MNICMAHRGWSGKAPENTMAAIKMAIHEPLVRAIEIDVQLSKDGVPVVIHDFTLERTTNGSGLVKDYTYKELSGLDAGSWFSSSFAEEKIPSLEEVLLAVKGRCRLNIELKTAGNLYPEIGRRVLTLIQQYGMRSEVCLTSFDHEVIRDLKEIDPIVETGLIISGMPTLLREQIKETGATILSMDFRFLTAEFVQRMISSGIAVIAWTVNEERWIEALMKMHPEIQICTNHPDRMMHVIKKGNR